MFISTIKIRNFRLLKDTHLDVKEDISLLIGKNNTGKTSLIAVFEKFFTGKFFDINDFPLCNRNCILEVSDQTEAAKLAIQLIIHIKYSDEDKLSDLSEFILDLDEKVDTVKILLECAVDKNRLLQDVTGRADKERFISKNLSNYTRCKVYAYQNDHDLEWDNRANLVEKDLRSLKNVINLQIIHAKRNVSSSEESTRDRDALSVLTNQYFKDNVQTSEDIFADINKKMIEMDEQLNGEYEKLFDPFLKTASDFLNITNLKVVSNVQSNELVANQSQVVYGSEKNLLPEHLNGLGFMNILYLLLNIEIRKRQIQKEGRVINLLFIEEPEAHTHPQMQYVFARQIKKIVEGIENLQTLITTHSSHIVSQCDFKDIRYLSLIDETNVVIKNFFDQMQKDYTEPDHFKFLVQYLSIQSSELFFADKILLIEGTTETILLPYFMRQFDAKYLPEGTPPLASQHISTLEVGANAKIFAPFLNFLGIKTLIITDIDSTIKKEQESDGKKTTTYVACPVKDSSYTSNYTIKHFLEAPGIGDSDFDVWYSKLKIGDIKQNSALIRVAYQTEESGYHGRSFEDAFLHINRESVKLAIGVLDGLKNKKLLDDDSKNPYELIDKMLDNKAAFAASLLYKGLTDDAVEWIMPHYIKEALTWLA